MKAVKKTISILLAMAILLSMAIPAFAQEIEPDTGSILIRNSTTIDASKRAFAAAKILDLQAWEPEGCLSVPNQYSVPKSMADAYERLYDLDKTAPTFASDVYSCLYRETDLSRILEETSATPYVGKQVPDGFAFTGLPLGCYIVYDVTPTGDGTEPAWEPKLVEVDPDCVIKEGLSAYGSIAVRGHMGYDISHMDFSAYRLLDLNYSVNEDGEIDRYDYSVGEEWVDFFASRYNLDKNAEDFTSRVITEIQEEEDQLQFLKAVRKAASTYPYTGILHGSSYGIDRLRFGYYAVFGASWNEDDRPIAAGIIDPICDVMEVTVFPEIPFVSVTVDCDKDPGTTADRNSANVAAIGDTVTYVIETEVPPMYAYEKYFFIVKGQLSEGLTYTNNMVVTLAGMPLTEGADYEVLTEEGEDGATGLQIVFKNFIQYDHPNFLGQPIEISYTAVLNETATIGNIPNINEVCVEYSAEDCGDYEGEDYPTEEDRMERYSLRHTPVCLSETYTTALEIVASDPLGNRLEGAEFTLTGEAMNVVRVERDVFEIDEDGDYWKLIDGSYTTISPDSIIDGAAVDQQSYDSISTKYRKDAVVELVPAYETKEVTSIVGEDGVLRFEGIGEGTFEIREINPPEGYNILTELANVSITWNEETQVFEYEGAVDKNGTACIQFIHIAGSVPPPDPETDYNLTLNHSLNLADDISLNYIVPESLLEGYDMDTVALIVEIPEYEGNICSGYSYTMLLPEKRDGFYYFTLTGLTAVQMNDRLTAWILGTKDGVEYESPADTYSIATYAMSQLNKVDISSELKTLCANLLRYGAKAQVFKGYRTNALADASMTPQHKTYLTDLDAVTFGNNYLEIPNSTDVSFLWEGKGLNLGTRVGLTFRFLQINTLLPDEAWKILIHYRNMEGEQITYEVDKSQLTCTESPLGLIYEFTFSELTVAELRNVVCVTICDWRDEPWCSDLIYSADTYGNGKTGILGDVCKALFAYSDSAKAFFTD